LSGERSITAAGGRQGPKGPRWLRGYDQATELSLNAVLALSGRIKPGQDTILSK